MSCPQCKHDKFHYCNWQDSEDDINRYCDNCGKRYTPAKPEPINKTISELEFWEYVEIEGLEYYVCYKSDEWRYLENKQLRELCQKLYDIHQAIMALK